MAHRSRPAVIVVVVALCLVGLPAHSQVKTDPNVARIRAHFGEQYFVPDGGFVLRQGQTLPALVWENPKLAALVLKDIRIPTRWFDEDLVEVKTASKPGRYYAYGEGPVPDGLPLRRAMTCCCVEDDGKLAELATKLIPSIRAEKDVEKKRAEIESTVQRWRTSEAGAIALAALLAGDPVNPQSRDGQWQMENSTRHVRLKRKLMGLDRKPPVVVAPKPITGEPAPTLRVGSLEEAQITPELQQQLEAKCDEWYRVAKQPTAFVIARNGVIVFAKGYGEKGGKPVTVNTPMLLHSAMKPLMGVQLAMYMDRGIVRLDEPIGNHLPEFSTAADKNLTFRAAHVHATGILFPWELAFRRLFYFQTWQDTLVAHCAREWAPGAKRRYGCVGMILSVRALELASGKNYWHAMEGELFGPLGIKDALPGGTGFSAEDFARIGVLLHNKGRYGKQEFFSEKTYESILPTSLKPYFPKISTVYGIGFKNAAGRLGPGTYGHGGGCGTQIIVNPGKRLVFAMVRDAPGEEYKARMADIMAHLRSWIGE